MIRRDMYQWQCKFGAGLSDIRSKVYIDVLRPIRIGLTRLYAGEAGSVDNNLGLNRFKRTGKVVSRFEINLSRFDTSK